MCGSPSGYDPGFKSTILFNIIEIERFMTDRPFVASLLLAALVSPAVAQTTPQTTKPLTMAEKMRVCAQMRDDMAHRQPMSAEGMKLMAECQRMERQRGPAAAPAATLDR